MSVQIRLNKKELQYLESQKHVSNLGLRKYNRINILLLSHKGKRPSDIEEFLGVDRITNWRTQNRYVEQGVEKALEEEPRTGQPKKYNTKHEAELAALACGPCPDDRTRWTVRLVTKAL